MSLADEAVEIISEKERKSRLNKIDLRRKDLFEKLEGRMDNVD